MDSAQHNDIHQKSDFKLWMHNSREIARETNDKLERGIERDRLWEQVKEEQSRIEENRRATEKEQEREKAQSRCEMAQLEYK